jgi:ATP-dependent Clp protease ATP-binding subunit ClpB
VNFRNTVVIMTSNIGSPLLLEGVSARGEIEPVVRDSVFKELRAHFRPEFLNRVDELIIFNPLSREDLQRILKLQLDDVLVRLRDRGISVELDQKGADFLIAQGFSEDFGARPLRRAIERFVEDPLAEQLLRFEGKAFLIRVTVSEDQKSLLFQQDQSAKTDPLPEQEPVASGAGDTQR